jgi:hypothetical protein
MMLGVATAPGGRTDDSAAYRGTPVFDPAKVDIVRGTNSDTITLKAPVATINWTPTDNRIDQFAGPINSCRKAIRHLPTTRNIPNFAVLEPDCAG